MVPPVYHTPGVLNHAEPLKLKGGEFDTGKEQTSVQTREVWLEFILFQLVILV